ncbi:MAG: BMP family ABC transporter substrate-binding protein [Solirubrobacteraceae bacterium]
MAQPTAANDHSFGEATHDGAVQAQSQLGIKLNEVDSLTTPSAQQTALENMARVDHLVLMQGGISAAAISSKFPSTQFVVTDGTLPPRANNHSVIDNWLPVAYLGGVAAAHATKSHVISFIGGPPIPPIQQGLQGFTAGAKSVNPSIKVLSTYTGSLSDAGKAKTAASAQIDQGSDVIYADLDNAHIGIVQAAKESGKNVKVIGSVAPKCTISDGLDIGDTLFPQARIVDKLITDYVHTGKLPAVQTFGLAGGYSLFKLCPGASKSLQAALASTSSGLLSGKIKPTG